LKSDFRGDSEKVSCPVLGMAGIILLAVCLFTPAPLTIHAATLSGDSRTIFRMQKTVDDRNLYPLYEYLNFGLESEQSQGFLSGNIGGWGRLDLGDKRDEKRDEATLQYGTVSYRGKKSNLAVIAGRQFVAEGVAAERIDGLYLRNDLKGGFTAAAYVGSPVVTEPNFAGGNLIYGGRIAHSQPRYYTIGVSVLRTDKDSDRLREEMGIDLWARPFAKLDIVGRSSYNSITSGWMEHTYNVSFVPLASLKVNADLSKINYQDYFHNVTTAALSLAPGLLDPGEKVFTLGGNVEYMPFDFLSVSVDYKNYDYDIAGAARYYGGRINFYLPESFMAGFSVHRMAGDNSKLQFDEYRFFASKKIGKADLTVDLFDVNYDSAIDDRKNVYSLAAAISYELTEQLKVAADIDYGRTTELDRQLSGLVKLTYYFDKEFGRNKRGQ